MRSLLAFALCAASFAALHAQDAPDPPPSMVQQKRATTRPAPSLPIGRITGTVFCADTHRPARGALVMLAPKPDSKGGQNESMSRVGMDGSYAFEHISPGEYAVVAVLPGYLNPFDDVTIAPNTDDKITEKIWNHESEGGILRIIAGEALKFDIELQRGAAISGRVFYSDGAPAAQVVIEAQNIAKDTEKTDPAEPSINLGGFLREAARQPLSTDDVGHFRLSGLSPGTYRVMAVELSKDHADGFGDAGALYDPSAVRVYAGDTMHRKAAKTYDLRAGEETSGIDITIPIEAFHSVRGHLSAVDGRPVNMGDLKLTEPDDDAFAMSTKLQNDGSFNFPSVPAGTYTLSATNARIGEIPGDIPAQFENTVSLVPKTAFGDSTQSIVVADVDVADVNIALTEVPMPKPTAHPR